MGAKLSLLEEQSGITRWDNAGLVVSMLADIITVYDNGSHIEFSTAGLADEKSKQIIIQIKFLLATQTRTFFCSVKAEELCRVLIPPGALQAWRPAMLTD